MFLFGAVEYLSPFFAGLGPIVWSRQIGTWTEVRLWSQLHVLFKVGLGISRANADSHWNPVYNAFHRFFWCGNETIRR